MSKQRYVIQGEWSGPRNPAGNYTRIQHREVTTNQKLIDFCGRTHGIRYDDGTMLYLSCRPCQPREVVKEILGYSSLIRECAAKGVDSVAALYELEKVAH
jgi:hypothetical protein